MPKTWSCLGQLSFLILHTQSIYISCQCYFQVFPRTTNFLPPTVAMVKATSFIYLGQCKSRTRPLLLLLTAYGLQKRILKRVSDSTVFYHTCNKINLFTISYEVQHDLFSLIFHHHQSSSFPTHAMFHPTSFLPIP